jgi:hypothetical protein
MAALRIALVLMLSGLLIFELVNVREDVRFAGIVAIAGVAYIGLELFAYRESKHKLGWLLDELIDDAYRGLHDQDYAVSDAVERFELTREQVALIREREGDSQYEFEAVIKKLKVLRDWYDDGIGRKSPILGIRRHDRRLRTLNPSVLDSRALPDQSAGRRSLHTRSVLRVWPPPVGSAVRSANHSSLRRFLRAPQNTPRSR